MTQTKVQNAFDRLMDRIATEYQFESQDKDAFLQYVKEEFAKEVLPLVDESYPVPVRPVVLAPTNGKKKVSGYNVYTGAQLKEKIPMKDVGPAWKALSEPEKQKWIEQANARNHANGHTNNKQKRKRPLTGYNLYTQKYIKDLGGMTKVGITWKALSQEERDQAVTAPVVMAYSESWAACPVGASIGESSTGAS